MRKLLLISVIFFSTSVFSKLSENLTLKGKIKNIKTKVIELETDAATLVIPRNYLKKSDLKMNKKVELVVTATQLKNIKTKKKNKNF